MKNNQGFVSSKFVLGRIEENEAVLLDNGNEILLPKKYLPKDVKEGDTIVLNTSTEEADRIAREKTAKELLNELLGNDK